MCNVMGDVATVRRKREGLLQHCETVGRDPAEITFTHLSVPGDVSTDDQIGRYRELAEAGVQMAIVGTTRVADIERFAPVIAAFR